MEKNMVSASFLPSFLPSIFFCFCFFWGCAMAQNDPWMRDFEDALRIAEDVISRIAERNSSQKSSGSNVGSLTSDNVFSAIRRKITMLGTRLDSLQSLLSNPSLTKSL